MKNPYQKTKFSSCICRRGTIGKSERPTSRWTKRSRIPPPAQQLVSINHEQIIPNNVKRLASLDDSHILKRLICERFIAVATFAPLPV